MAESDLARILNVLAHEIRTPLAVSQGYLKLMAEGRLNGAGEQANAIERARTALGTIASLCTEMGRLGGLADEPAVSLRGRVTVASVIERVNEGLAQHSLVGTGQLAPEGLLATDGSHDLAAAVAALGTMVCADAGPEEKVMTVSAASGPSVTLLLGGVGAVAALPPHADDPAAAALMLVRGGFGLSLFWAAIVLERHGVRAWQGRDATAAMGVTFPVVRV